jgi:hypothetical protein
MLYATSKVVIEHIPQGYAYSKIKKVISINILYFDFGDGDDYIYKGTTNFEGIHTHNKLYLNETISDNPKAKKLFDAKVDIETIKLSTGLTDMELANLTNQWR